MIAYENVKAEEKGRRTYTATRTRQAIKRHGLKTAVERIVCAGESMGFRTIPFEMTFEQVILDNADCFSAPAVRVSRERKDAVSGR